MEPPIFEGPMPGEIVEGTIEPEIPSLEYINDRIFEYGRKLERWKELDSKSMAKALEENETAEMVSCFRRLQNVVKGYSDLRSKVMLTESLPSPDRISDAAIFELQKNDIEFMESSCARLLASEDDVNVDWNQREEGADLSQLEILIERYSENREYEEVVQVWQKIPESQLKRVHLRAKILYGNALMYLHQEDKAAEIYQQVVDQMSDSNEQATDLVSLRKILADLYTASGNYKAAAIEYNKISDDYQNIGQLEQWSKLQLSILDRSMGTGPELQEYASLLRNYLGFIPEQDGYKVLWQAEKFLEEYPYSPVVSNVDAIKEKTKEAADRWFDGFMAGVENLTAEKKFDGALEKLETLPVDILEPEKQRIVKGKNEELMIAEAVDKETDRVAIIQGLQNQWNEAMLFMNEEKYDEAITVFANLLDSEYSVKAAEKIKEASLEAANADRKKAAGLFMRFTKTTDLESRKKLLLESRRLLKNILVKYPDVEIAPKVNSNIERVEQEMFAIDPALMVLEDQEEVPNTGFDGADRVFAPLGTDSGEQQPNPAQELQINQ
ncbi:MAG: hypothetical protein VR65_20715 [Desulfobulbaceae bacterium BRH_c16a]|nr:MAG: hypothetical protein VR65_20715 [Desulfobulbaceae bacterium BRH_c16a]